MEIPDGLRYTEEHEWARAEPDGRVRIGITAFAQEQLGDIVYVQLPAPGTRVAAGAACGEVESVKTVSEIYSPLAGEILARNDALEERPELVNADPYGDGWIAELRPDDPAAWATLLDAAAYRAHLGGGTAAGG